MKFLTSLPLALLSGHALATCGTLSVVDNLQMGPACDLGPHNLYTCGDGTRVRHDGSQIRLQAANANATVLVNCENFTGFLFYCGPHERGVFTEKACAGPVSSINLMTTV
ncbi:hypothetical protein E4U35_003841 [Claviceps purpurea]|nr:hypothetical protein E4U27_002521 [Claviceps purpurea]KAG6203977.1 hypothetical protein E4U35_003841 [Claviceps purpurea]KAG6215103.1 hypothetical protein E4U26_000139 [Claviceps purpurea]KAG6221976.1 hypothetical protein E4U34_001712 [Claviceps purpurea]